MKWNPLGRLRARYFGEPATSVPPKIPVMTVAELLEEFKPGGRFHYAGAPQVRSEPAPSEPQAGLKPPTDQFADGWTWDAWRREMTSQGHYPGWAFCRFANRTGETNVQFVFGHVRGPFGVWRKPYDICHDEGQTTDILTAMTHLPSGLAVGVFAETAVAIEAAELADRVCADWAVFQEYEQLGPLIARTREAWDGVGIVPCTNAHGHSDHTRERFTIIGRSIESITAGKPEKLS